MSLLNSDKFDSLTAILALFFLLALNSGCATRTPQPMPISGPPVSATAPIVGLEGYRDASRFYVKYRQDGRIGYAGGNWRDAVKLVEEPLPGAPEFAAPKLVAMEYHRQEPWELPQDAVPIPVFDVDEWQALRDGLLRRVVPGGKAGVVVDFEHVEYFLYRDKQARMRAVRAEHKPFGYRIHERLRFDEFMRRGRPLLEEFMRRQGISGDELVFNTGDAGPYSLPFLYINTNRQLLIFVRNVPSDPGAVTRVPGMKTSQAFGHFMRSHLTNLALRPVSSLHRLFFVVTDTTVGTLKFDWATALAEKPVPPLSERSSMDLESWERELDQIAGRQVFGASVDFLVDGEAFFDRLVAAIEAARESIDLQIFIFDNDDYAVRIADLLKRRSREGIEVRVLLDGLGTIAATLTDSASQPEYHDPPESVRLYLEAGSKVSVRQKPNPWFTADHVKSIVIDDEIAFIGGMNIGREYRYDWHDMMIEMRGPVVDAIGRDFDSAWAHAGVLGDLGYLFSRLKPGAAPGAGDDSSLRILLTRPGDYEIYNAQLAAIRRSQSYIYVQNAYFTDDRMLRELVMARRRGVDVRVVIPMETDNGAIDRSNVLAANLMFEHGIRVYIYPGFSHVKAAIYDGWVCAGSANFDRLSLRINRELNIASSDPAVARQLLERLFEPDFGVSLELTEPIPERWVDHLVEMIGDYLF